MPRFVASWVRPLRAPWSETPALRKGDAPLQAHSRADFAIDATDSDLVWFE